MLGLVIVTGIQSYLSKSFSERSQSLASSDLVVESRGFLDDHQLSKIDFILAPYLEKSSIKIEMLSMVDYSSSSSDLSHLHLSSLQFVDENFPLYGSITLQDHTQLKDFIQQHQKLDVVAMFKEDLIKYNLKNGSVIKINDRPFIIKATILQSEDYQTMVTRLAPRIYLSSKTLEYLELVQKGSTITVEYLYRLNKLDKNPAKKLNQLVDLLDSQIDDPSISIFSHFQSSGQIARLLNLVGGYLHLITLITFLLASIGCFFLLRVYLVRKFKDIVIMISLGLSQQKVMATIIIEIGLLALLGGILAIVFGYFASVLIDFITKNLSSGFFSDIGFGLSYTDLGFLLSLSVFCGLSLSLPYLVTIITAPSAQLLTKSGFSFFANQVNGLIKIFSYFLITMVFWVVAVVKFDSFFVGGLFLALVLLALGIMILLSKVLQKIFSSYGNRSFRKSSFYFKAFNIALMWLKRADLSFVTAFITICLSVMLMTIVLILTSQVVSAISDGSSSSSERSAKLSTDSYTSSSEDFRAHFSNHQQTQRSKQNTNLEPDYFLIDIQHDQINQIEQILQHSLIDGDFYSWRYAPFFIAKHTLTNGKPPQKPHRRRYRSTSSSFNDKEVRLSYLDHLKSSESIIQGKFYQGSYQSKQDKLPEISVEVEYAKRQGLKLGDRMSFYSGGYDVEGEITSMRKIDWLSFQPNFFIQFQPGVLENIPHSYIGLLSFDPSVIHQHSVINKLAKEFSNIVVIEIKKAVTVVRSIVSQVSIAIIILGLLVLIAGIFILGAIIYYSVRSRQKNICLLSVLGLKNKTIFLSLIIEFLIITASAGFFGAIIASVIGNQLASWILKLDGDFYRSLGYGGFVASTLVILAIFVATRIVYLVCNKPLVKTLQ